MAPAIALAEDGVIVTPGLAEELQASHDTFAKYPSTAAIFLKPDGSDYQPGDKLVQERPRELAEGHREGRRRTPSTTARSDG